MSTRAIVLSVIAALLAVIYVAFFTNWFRTEPIPIVWQMRPGRPSTIPRPADQAPVYPVSFSFDRDYRLTSIKVVAEADLATNKNPNAWWHLVSEDGSAPTRSFLYGLPIVGMKPAQRRARPKALLPETKYVLLVEAGNEIGRTNFWTREALPVTARK